jgi:hypothetical protein
VDCNLQRVRLGLDLARGGASPLGSPGGTHPRGPRDAQLQQLALVRQLVQVPLDLSGKRFRQASMCKGVGNGQITQNKFTPVKEVTAEEVITPAAP